MRKKHSWIFDRSNVNWEQKRKLISEVNPVITVPSKWMKSIVEKSALQYQSVHVIYNGINPRIFYPRAKINNYGISLEKKVILGVADRWDEKKGLDVFINLAKVLDERFQIVLVGTSQEVDEKLPSNIVSIHRTSNQEELAEIYSSADVFVNTTREEVLGLVNLEALACGIPVVTFNTGGSPECIDCKTGVVVEKNNLEELVEAIVKSSDKKNFSARDCIERASLFDEKEVYKEYFELYKQVAI